MVLFWQQHLPARVLAVGILGAFALSTLTLPVARAQLACTQQNSLFFYQQGKSASFQSKIIAIFLIKECCTGGLARTGTASIRIWRHFIPPPPSPPQVCPELSIPHPPHSGYQYLYALRRGLYRSRCWPDTRRRCSPASPTQSYTCTSLTKIK